MSENSLGVILESKPEALTAMSKRAGHKIWRLKKGNEDLFLVARNRHGAVEAILERFFPTFKRPVPQGTLAAWLLEERKEANTHATE